MLRRLVLTLALFAIASPASAQQKLTLLLDWFVNPDHGPLFVAQERGYFAEAGLSVEMIAPADPNDPPKLVAAGRADLALSYQPQLTIQAAGDQGLLALGGLSGLLDVDPITLSSATMVREGLAPDVAARAILIAATANIAAKTFLGALFGGARLGMALASGAALAVGAGLTVMLL